MSHKWANILQEDLVKLEFWEKFWDMFLNPSKYQVLHGTRLENCIPSKHILHNTVLASLLQNTKGHIPDDLNWGSHISNSTKKVNQTLGYVRRNQDLKSAAYKTLIQQQLEYASSAGYHTQPQTSQNWKNDMEAADREGLQRVEALGYQPLW